MSNYRTLDTLSDMIGNKIIDSRDIISRLNDLESERETNLETLDEQNTRIVYLSSIRDTEGTPITDEELNELDTLERSIWTAKDGTEYAESGDWDEDTAEEYLALKAIDEECGGYGDWSHGESLIADSYFEEYAQQLAEDCCDMKNANQWPFTCIDWERAAKELQQDYSSFELQGETYWMRD